MWNIKDSLVLPNTHRPLLCWQRDKRHSVNFVKWVKQVLVIQVTSSPRRIEELCFAYASQFGWDAQARHSSSILGPQVPVQPMSV